MTLQPDRARNIMVPPLLAKGTRSRCRFLGGSDTRIIMDFDEAALIRLSHGQNVQMKCQRSFGVITGDPRRTRAHVAKWSTAHALRLRPVRGKYSRASNRQRRTVGAWPAGLMLAGYLLHVLSSGILGRDGSWVEEPVLGSLGGGRAGQSAAIGRPLADRRAQAI